MQGGIRMNATKELEICFGWKLFSLFIGNGKEKLMDGIERFRKSIEKEKGINLSVTVKDDMTVEPQFYRFSLDGKRICDLRLLHDGDEGISEILGSLEQRIPDTRTEAKK